MNLKRVNIYKDSRKYLALLKYMGLITYSLPKPRQQRLRIARRDVAITVLSLLAVAMILISCNLCCLMHREKSDAIGIIAYTCLDLEIVAIVLCSHLQSRGLVEIFSKSKATDEKLLKLTESNVLIVKKERVADFLVKLKHALPLITMLFDAVIITFNRVGKNVSLQLLFCLAIPHISNVLRSQSGSLYTFFIGECTARVKYISNAIEGLLLLKQKIACIETSLAPKANAWYKVDEARNLLSDVLDVVSKINKTFQLHMLIKSLHISIVLLLVAYYAGNVYLFNRNISAVAAVVYCLYLTGHSLVQLFDLLIDIWFYKKLQQEVVLVLSFCELYRNISS